MIEVGRNSIVIRNVDFKSQNFKNFNYNFSLYDKVLHKYTFSIYTIIDKNIYLPASIGTDEVKKYFPSKEVLLNYNNTASSGIISYKMNNQPRDKLQREAILFLMQMKDDDKKEKFLSLSTGTGKTYVTINVISRLKKRPFIIVDTLELAYQWKKEFLMHSALLDEEIVIFSGNDSIEKELKEKKGKAFIAIHRTIGNIIEEDTNGINLLMNKLKIGIRVFDEAHVNFKNVCMINALSNVEYTIYLTATPGRSKFTDDYLYGKVFRKIDYFDGKNIINKKYHTVVMCQIDSKPSIEEKLSVKTKYGFNSSRWASFIESNSYEILLEIIRLIFDKFQLKNRDKKVAIMLPTISLIKKLEKDLRELELDPGMFIEEVKKTDREEALKKKVILTNDKIFDKGIDVKDLEVLINFVPLGSIIKTEQIMGRLRYKKNKSSILIDITDKGYEECIRQMKIRRRFYKKRAKQIIDIE